MCDVGTFGCGYFCRHLDSPIDDVQSAEVLKLMKISYLSAYDCEFVASARALNLQLVTTDKHRLKAFHAAAIAMEDFAQ